MAGKAVIDQIEIRRDGLVGVRIAKQFIDATGKVVHEEWHRTIIAPEDDAGAQMARVNAHLMQMGFSEVSVSEIQQIREYVTLKRNHAKK